MKCIKSFSFFISFTLIIVFFSGCTENITNSGVVEITSITHSPENPDQDDKITITVRTKNSNGCHLNYDAYFAGGSGGSQTMSGIGNSRYEAKIGPFNEGTEVWYMVSADRFGGDFTVSESYVIQIGHVERSNITSLNISNINQSPQNVTSKNTEITISAIIKSDVMIMDTWFIYKHFKAGGSGGGMGPFNYKTEDIYEEVLNFEYYDDGTKIYYKIAAQDESGNTAVAPTFSFEF